MIYLVVAHFHRLVLASKCDFFRVMFGGGWSETEQSEMVFTFPDPLNVFPLVLQFLYTNKIEVTAETFPATFALAEQLQISSLKVCAKRTTYM